jgi:hypothetical protein
VADRGQAIVEFALIFPVLAFVMLGFIEYGFASTAKAHQDRETALIAEWAANHPGESWNSIANQELPGCAVDVTLDKDIYTATVTCQYQPRVTSNIWAGLPMTSVEHATP